MAKTDTLKTAVDAMVEQVKATKGVEASAVTLINNFADITKQKVTAALEENDAADQTSIDAAVAAIEEARTAAAASSSELGAAVTTNQ